jgi:hypothetical protein
VEGAAVAKVWGLLAKIVAVRVAPSILIDCFMLYVRAVKP